ncbi:UNVERIFIED_CONTAM: hypothetical protein GTU68_053532 [Idotea baltica]|nr:hypothetical protein [Idotea baltica]
MNPKDFRGNCYLLLTGRL